MPTDPPQPPESAEESEEQSSHIQLWLIVLATLVLGGVVEVIMYGYIERPGWIGVSGKRFWDYLDLLIVPAALALGVYWLNLRQDEREREAEDTQQRREQDLQENRAQDEALQAYLNQMSQMITDKDQPLHGAKPRNPLSLVAQLQTRTVLRRLDPKHKREVVQFLSEMGLIQSSQFDSISEELREMIEGQPAHQEDTIRDAVKAKINSIVQRGEAVFEPAHQIVVSLERADLRDTDLRDIELANAQMPNADLHDAKLDDVELPNATLVRARLNGATLRGTDLWGANLNYAYLNNADLSGADLTDAKLSETKLQHAILRDACLMDANMEKVDLQGADLTGVEFFPGNLTKANMSGAKGILDSEDFLSSLIVEEVVLTGATMPNGQTYEQWKVSEGVNTLTEAMAHADAHADAIVREMHELLEAQRNRREDGKKE